MKLSYKMQSALCVFIVGAAFVLSTFYGQNIINNIGWTIVGALFIINPVFPHSKWVSEEELKKNAANYRKYTRIIGVLFIIFGWTINFTA